TSPTGSCSTSPRRSKGSAFCRSETRSQSKLWRSRCEAVERDTSSSKRSKVDDASGSAPGAASSARLGPRWGIARPKPENVAGRPTSHHTGSAAWGRGHHLRRSQNDPLPVGAGRLRLAGAYAIESLSAFCVFERTTAIVRGGTRMPSIEPSAEKLQKLIAEANDESPIVMI